MTEEEINKLPKWAQREVNTLQMNLRDALAELERMRSNPESNTFVGHPVTKDVQYLKNHAQVTFMLPTGKITVYVSREGFVDVNANSGETFSITPRASNACELRFTNR